MKLTITELQERHQPRLVKFTVIDEDEGMEATEIVTEPYVHFHSDDDELYISWLCDAGNSKIFDKFKSKVTVIKEQNYFEASTSSPMPIPTHYYLLPNHKSNVASSTKQMLQFHFSFDDVVVNGETFPNIDSLMIRLNTIFGHHNHIHKHNADIDLDAFYNYVRDLIKTRSKKPVNEFFIPELITDSDVIVEYHRRLANYHSLEGLVFLQCEIEATLDSEINNHLDDKIIIKIPDKIKPTNNGFASWFGSCYIFNMDTNIKQLYIPCINYELDGIVFVRSHNIGTSFDTLIYGDLDIPNKVIIALSIQYLV
jgi:hypothetical protein